MKTISILLAGLVAGTLLTACGDTEPGGDGGTITDITWRLVGGSVDGSDLVRIADAPVTILFAADGTVGGVAACNSYGGTVIVDGSDVSFPEPLFQTEMACLDQGVMELESAFLAALARVTGLAAGSETLVLTGNGVELRFEVEPPEPDAALVGTEWNLETLQRGETASTPVAPSSILFAADGTVSGTTGCNGFSGAYDAEAGFGPLISTLMACEEAVNEQEQFVHSLLVPGATVTIEGSLLTIADLEGNALVYRAS